jgi:hypothetical protein
MRSKRETAQQFTDQENIAKARRLLRTVLRKWQKEQAIKNSLTEVAEQKVALEKLAGSVAPAGTLSTLRS